MPEGFEPILAFLRSSGLAQEGEAPRAEPLTGGVSSDIWKVELQSGPVCVKRALPRLRVKQLWEAPVGRNRYERLWMETARAIVPGIAPEVLAWDDAGFFAMAYLDPATHPLWKAELAAGRVVFPLVQEWQTVRVRPARAPDSARSAQSGGLGDSGCGDRRTSQAGSLRS